MKITYVEHACFVVETKGISIVVDPFFSDAHGAKKSAPRLFNPDRVLITHGHGDHLGGLYDIAGNKTTVFTIVELAGLLGKQGFKTIGMNVGGTVDLGGVTAAMVKAEHTSSFDYNGQSHYAGLACGFVVSDGDTTAYFAGDTDIFGDMALIGKYYSPDIAVLPVGGHYTMDVKKAVFCCNELLKTKYLIPMHYDTFPAIRADLTPLKTQLISTEPVILGKGESRIF